MTTVGLVVVAYHRPDCLRSLLQSVAEDIDEIVVVNVEADSDVAMVARHHQAVVVDIANVGFGGGVNSGTAVLESEIAVVANDDVRFFPGAVSALVEVVEARGGVAAPRVLAPGGSAQHTVAANVSLWSLTLEWMLLPDKPPAWWRGSAVHKWRRPTDLEAVPGVAAVVVAAPRSLFVDQPVPEQYFMYWEDREWFTRLAAHGETVWFQPAAVVEHVGGRDTVRPDKQRLLVRNAVRAVRRTRGRLAAAAAVPVVIGWQTRGVLTAGAACIRRRDLDVVRARYAGLVAALGSVNEVWRSDLR